MIEETANVIGVEGDELVLEADRKSACGGCAVKAGCGTSVISKVLGQHTVQFRLKNSLNASIGDRVVVGLNEKDMLLGSVLIYFMPLLCMIICSLLAYQFISDNEVLVMGAGLAGLLSGLLLARNLSRSGQSLSFEPFLLRKLL